MALQHTAAGPFILKIAILVYLFDNFHAPISDREEKFQ
jgi:hypothetical protein